jgi:hypothetical protein
MHDNYLIVMDSRFTVGPTETERAH